MNRLLQVAGDSPSEYVTHHLQHWQVSIGEGAFWTINIDSMIMAIAIGVLGLGLFWFVGRRATAGVPLHLLVIAGAAYSVRYFGGDWGRALQMTLLFAGLVLLGALLFSGALRAKLRVLISKHLFSYRYDYRNEWLRLINYLAQPAEASEVNQRAFFAVASTTKAPSGAIWLRKQGLAHKP